MSYDMIDYWTKRGSGYYREFKDQNLVTRLRFRTQERAICSYLKSLDELNTVLEVGCGFGRVTKLIAENFPGIESIEALDLSMDQINRAKELVRDSRVSFHVKSAFDIDSKNTFDLVIASELLLHIPPNMIEELIAKLLAASKRHVINIDWYDPGSKFSTGDYCFQHDYTHIYSSFLGNDGKVKVVPISDIPVLSKLIPDLRVRQAIFHATKSKQL